MRDAKSEKNEARHPLLEKRAELHGKRRRLHERLSEVCEDFALQPLSLGFRRKTLVRELGYLLDYYRDDTSWEEVS
jgi:hypothetical protein